MTLHKVSTETCVFGFGPSVIDVNMAAIPVIEISDRNGKSCTTTQLVREF